MIDSTVLERLRGIGLTPSVVQQLVALQGADDHTLLRVVEVQREGLALHDGTAEHAARLLPALRARLAEQSDAVAVGDWVLASRNTLSEWWVHDRVPPVSQLARRLHDGRDKVTRVVIVSNVDTALLVMSLDHDFSLRRLERYVALAQMAHVSAVVVLTKADLCDDTAARIAEVQALFPAGAAVVALNALAADARQALAPWLQPGQTLVLLGSSGTGKSTLTNTLTNTLTGSDVAITGATRSGDSRGRHTTTFRALIPLPSGACLIDTPGMRELKPTGEEQVADGGFADIETLTGECRFRDCQHAREPGCAVRAALEAGTLDPARLANYLKLRDEVAGAADKLATRLVQNATAKTGSKPRHKPSDDRYGKE